MNQGKMESHLTVVYFCSDSFSEPCGVSIVSLFENNKEFEMIDVYIVQDGISTHNIDRFNQMAENYERNIVFIEMPKPEVFFGDPRFTISSVGHTYCRMIVGKLLPEAVKRVICLDSDMLIVAPVKELWCTNMGDHYVAGVDSAPGIKMMEKTLKIEPGTLYCNGGLFLMNLEAIRRDDIETRYVNYMKKVFDEGGVLGAYEEEVINKCTYPRLLRLPPEYNLMTVNLVMDYQSFIRFRGAVNYYTEYEMENAIKHPVIIHAINTFYVKKRIWEKNSDSPYALEYIYFRNKSPWKDFEMMEIKRNIKQRFMKMVWHLMPKKVSFWAASFVRNEIRPRMTKKRDDE